MADISEPSIIAGRKALALFVQNFQKLLHSLKRLSRSLARVHNAIALALQRCRTGSESGFAQSAGQECRRDGLRSDVEFHDAKTLASEPEPCRGKKSLRYRWRFAKATPDFVFQVLQIVFVSAPDDTAID